MSNTITTLDDYLRDTCSDMNLIIRAIGKIGIILSDKIRNLPIFKHNHPEISTCNIHGESQTSLDVQANILFQDYLTPISCIKSIVSEEDDEITMVNLDGKYMVAYDPIDGSSNIDLNIPIGSIFGIYDNNIIKCSGYILYGSGTVYILAINKEITMFTLDDTNQWVLTQNKIRIPLKGPSYSINEGNEKYWNDETKHYIRELKLVGKHSLRYIGSMVADIHRTLLTGGIFIYPEDVKNPNGKLRQLYEVNPMSYIIEIAGGVSYSGSNKVRCLDVPIEDIHQKSPIFIGSINDVEDALNIMLSYRA